MTNQIYKTSSQRFPVAMIGLPRVDRAIRHMNSVTFLYEEGDAYFSVRAHRHEYDRAVRRLKDEAEIFTLERGLRK